MLKLMPMNVYDVAAQQARLEDLAARGGLPSLPRGSLHWLSLKRGPPRRSATGWSPPQ